MGEAMTKFGDELEKKMREALYQGETTLISDSAEILANVRYLEEQGVSRAEALQVSCAAQISVSSRN